MSFLMKRPTLAQSTIARLAVTTYLITRSAIVSSRKPETLHRFDQNRQLAMRSGMMP